MLTPTHGCLANLFSWSLKRTWTRLEHFLFFLGSIFPDLPVITVGFVEWIKYVARLPAPPDLFQTYEAIVGLLFRSEVSPVAGEILSNVGYYPTALWLRQCFHSVFFWVLILLFAKYLLKGKRLEVFSWGAMFFHLFVDWPTHLTHAHKYFWPLIDSPIPGFISQENAWLFRAELGIWLLWLAILLLRGLWKLNPKQY